MEEAYACMYTKHKTKKHKTWHDGVLVVSRACKRVQLFATNDAGQRAQLQETFAANGVLPVSEHTSLTGLEFEMEGHLVEVGERSSVATAAAAAAPVIQRSSSTISKLSDAASTDQSRGERGDARSAAPRRRTGISRMAGRRRALDEITSEVADDGQWNASSHVAVPPASVKAPRFDAPPAHAALRVSSSAASEHSAGAPLSVRTASAVEPRCLPRNHAAHVPAAAPCVAAVSYGDEFDLLLQEEACDQGPACGSDDDVAVQLDITPPDGAAEADCTAQPVHDEYDDSALLAALNAAPEDDDVFAMLGFRARDVPAAVPHAELLPTLPAAASVTNEHRVPVSSRFTAPARRPSAAPPGTSRSRVGASLTTLRAAPASSVQLPPPWVCGVAQLQVPCTVCGRCEAPAATGAATSHTAPRKATSSSMCRDCFWSLPPARGGDAWVAYSQQLTASICKQIHVDACTAATSLWNALKPLLTGNSAAPLSADSVRSAARSCGVHLYVQCDLLRMKPAKPSEDERDPDDATTLGSWIAAAERAAAASRQRLFLRFSVAEKEAASAYGRDDLWIVSTDLAFGCDLRACNWADPPALAMPASASASRGGAKSSREDYFTPTKASQPFTVIARSNYHGIASSGMLELMPLCALQPAADAPSQAWAQLSAWPATGTAPSVRVAALRLHHVGAESTALEALCALASRAARVLSPLADVISGITPPSAHLTSTQLVGHVPPDLNRDQAATFTSVVSAASRLLADDAASPSVLLCHGCFGSGKTHTLAAIIQACAALRDERAPARHLRVLVAASTNIAVDRVLLALVSLGFTDVARVGSVPKISKQLLRYTLPATDTADGIEHTLQDLRKLLMVEEGRHAGRQDLHTDETSDSVDPLADLRSSIQLWEGKRDHLHNLQNASVIGTTCAAAAFVILVPQQFDIVVMDEASQLTEVAAAAPVLRFGARLLVAVGDPKQLPPVQSSTAPTAAGPRVDAAPPPPSFFERLLAAGAHVLPLRIQYRCHPVLADLASRLFYDGTLTSGIRPTQRACLVPGLPPLVVYDTSCMPPAAVQSRTVTSAAPVPASCAEQRMGDGSLRNPSEAKHIVRMIADLLRASVQPHRIGVICLYRAQVATVQQQLGTALPDAAAEVQVSTVDAFQGCEKDVILLSCTRTSSAPTGGGSSGGAGGFVDDARRLCVALTRARHHLLIVGCMRALIGLGLWHAIASSAVMLPGGWRHLTELRRVQRAERD